MLFFALLSALVGPPLASSPADATAVANLGGHAADFGSDGAARIRLRRAIDRPGNAVIDRQGRTVFNAEIDIRPVRDAKGLLIGPSQSTAAIWRFLADGSPDPSFGTRGVRVLAARERGYFFSLYGFALAPDDSIYVLTFINDFQPWVLHLNVDGSIDTDFGDDGDGLAPVPVPVGRKATDIAGFGFVPRPTGGVAVAYASEKSGQSGWQPAVGALDADGNAAAPFGTAGVARLGGVAGTGNPYTWIDGIRPRGDGGYVVATNAREPNSERLWAVRTDGSADTSYGDGGSVRFTRQGDLNATYAIGAFVVHPSGAITARAGTELFQFTPSGAPDAAFGGDGTITVSTTDDVHEVMVADGPRTLRVNRDGELERRLANGTLDATFGGDGAIAPEDAVIDGFGGFASIALRAGTAGVRPFTVLSKVFSDTALVRYNGAGQVDRSFGREGLQRWDLGDWTPYPAPGGTAAAVDTDGGVWVAATSDAPVAIHLDKRGKRITTNPEGGVVLDGFDVVHAIFASPNNAATFVGIGGGAIVALRLLNDGTPDPTFNGGRRVQVDDTATSWEGDTLASARLSDGSVIVTRNNRAALITADGHVAPPGWFDTGIAGRQMVAARGSGYVIGGATPCGLGSDVVPSITLRAQVAPGVDDPSFGDGGVAAFTHDRLRSNACNADRLLPSQGGFLVLSHGAVFRFMNDGAPDPDFDGPHGQTPVSVYDASDMAVQDDGAFITLSGNSAHRYRADGGVDDTYGAHGLIGLGMGIDTHFAVGAIAIDGKRLYAAGAVAPIAQTADISSDLAVLARDGDRTGGAPVLSLDANYVVWEGYAPKYNLTVRLDRVPDTEVSFHYAFTAGSAAVPQDAGFENWGFSPMSYGPSRRTANFLVPVVNDGEVEADETLSVHLTAANYALVDDTPGTITIRDDERQGSSSVRARRTITPGSTAGAFVAAGDIDGDGRDEVIASSDKGSGPRVRVFDGQQLTGRTWFDAYGASFTGGVRVAAADVDGDGRDEVVVAPGPGGGPHIRVLSFSSTGWKEIAAFMAYGPDMSAGVFVGRADVDGDGRDEIVTAPGAGGSAHVRVWQVAGASAREVAGFMAFDPAFRGGASVAGFDIDGDGRQEVAVGAGPGGGTRQVATFRINGRTATPDWSFNSFASGFAGGVFVAGGSISGYLAEELVVGVGSAAVSRVAINQFPPAARRVPHQFTAYESTFTGGVRIAAGDVDGDGRAELITVPGPGRAADVIVRNVVL